MRIEVGCRIYAYPYDLDQRVTSYVQKIKHMDQETASFG
jgi:hypothetical protein